jgi:hypothetical protein
VGEHADGVYSIWHLFTNLTFPVNVIAFVGGVGGGGVAYLEAACRLI